MGAENNWDDYWSSKDSVKGTLYDKVASFYRRFIIQPGLNHFCRKYFSSGSRLLHAGCGSGQVDARINRRYSIVALDNSMPALNIYRAHNTDRSRLVDADIRGIPFQNNVFDGIYNLGVMEHFTEKEIGVILSEFYRVLKPGGRLVIFWPPSFGISVIFLKMLKSISNRIFKKEMRLHPDEITLINSKDHAVGILKNANFDVKEYYFGPRDIFTQVVIVAGKKDE